jgi:hypothetical protein
MALRVVPEGLATTSAAVEAIAAQLAAAHAGLASTISAVIPPAADPVSVQAAATFSGRGAQHATAASRGVQVLGRAAAGTAEAGTNYAAGDLAAASTYLMAKD